MSLTRNLNETRIDYVTSIDASCFNFSSFSVADVYLVDAKDPLLVVYLLGYGISVIDLAHVRLATEVVVQYDSFDVDQLQNILTIIPYFGVNETILNVDFVTRFYVGDKMTFHLEIEHYAIDLVESARREENSFNTYIVVLDPLKNFRSENVVDYLVSSGEKCTAMGVLNQDLAKAMPAGLV